MRQLTDGGASQTGISGSGGLGFSSLGDIGVSQVLIDEWEEQVKRLKGASPAVSPTSYSLDPRTIEFLNGEHFSEDRREPNLLNNPLRLIRPESLHTYSQLGHFLGAGLSTFNQHGEHHSPSEVNRMHAYINLVSDFEALALEALKGLNNDDTQARLATIKGMLDKIYAWSEAKELLGGGVYTSKVAPAEKQANWIVYVVISLVDHESNEITPLGRLRALDLLQLYSVESCSMVIAGHVASTGFKPTTAISNFALLGYHTTSALGRSGKAKTTDEPGRIIIGFQSL